MIVNRRKRRGSAFNGLRKMDARSQTIRGVALHGQKKPVKVKNGGGALPSSRGGTSKPLLLGGRETSLVFWGYTKKKGEKNQGFIKRP